AEERRWSALAEAKAIRDAARTRANHLVKRSAGEKAAFLPKASAHATEPALSEFRMLWDTLATVLAGRPKLILDRRTAGRRHVLLAEPALVDSMLSRAAAPLWNAPADQEPDD